MAIAEKWQSNNAENVFPLMWLDTSKAFLSEAKTKAAELPIGYN